MKTLLSLALFVMLILLPLFAVAQVTCMQLGTITDCSGPNNYSSTQVPLGPSGGVIVTDRDTMPYTIIAPVQPNRPAFDPTPLTFGNPPTYQTQPPSYSSGPVFAPGTGVYTYGR